VAHDGRDAVAKYEEVGPDVLILDIMLPDTDGLQILGRIRESSTYTPTLFLTARDSLNDRITGIVAGADDYMTKPFSLEELVARLHGLLRRSSHMTRPDDEVLKVGDLVLHGGNREVTRVGVQIELTTTEFELLRYMMQNPNKALPRAEILERVWNYDFNGRTSVVDLYASYLRKEVDAGVWTARGTRCGRRDSYPIGCSFARDRCFLLRVRRHDAPAPTSRKSPLLSENVERRQ